MQKKTLSRLKLAALFMVGGAYVAHNFGVGQAPAQDTSAPRAAKAAAPAENAPSAPASLVPQR